MHCLEIIILMNNQPDKVRHTGANMEIHLPSKGAGINVQIHPTIVNNGSKLKLPAARKSKRLAKVSS